MQVHLSVINQAAGRGDWRASAWVLERRFTEEFVRPLQLEHSGRGESRWLLPTMWNQKS